MVSCAKACTTTAPPSRMRTSRRCCERCRAARAASPCAGGGAGKRYSTKMASVASFAWKNMAVASPRRRAGPARAATGQHRQEAAQGAPSQPQTPRKLQQRLARAVTNAAHPQPHRRGMHLAATATASQPRRRRQLGCVQLFKNVASTSPQSAGRNRPQTKALQPATVRATLVRRLPLEGQASNLDPKPDCSKRGIVAICKTCCKAYDQTSSGEQGLQRERSPIRLKLGFKQKAKVAADKSQQSATRPSKSALQQAAARTSATPDWCNRKKSVGSCDACRGCRKQTIPLAQGPRAMCAP